MTEQFMDLRARIVEAKGRFNIATLNGEDEVAARLATIVEHLEGLLERLLVSWNGLRFNEDEMEEVA